MPHRQRKGGFSIMSAGYFRRTDSTAFLRGLVSGFVAPLALFPSVKPQDARSDIERSFRTVGKTLNKNFRFETRNGGRSK